MEDAAPGPGASEARIQDEALISMMASYQRGDRQAAGALVEALSPMLYRFFCWSGGSSADNEDLLQDCWLRIHRARHSYRFPSPVLPWVFAIARNTRIDALRRYRRRQAREVDLDSHSGQIAAPMNAAPDSDLAGLLAGLPESQREVLWMMKVSGMSIEEVARATSSTVGSVKQKAHRAYEKLRLVLGARSGR